MSIKNEILHTEKYRCVDNSGDEPIYQKQSEWTSASDVEFTDETTLQEFKDNLVDIKDISNEPTQGMLDENGNLTGKKFAFSCKGAYDLAQTVDMKVTHLPQGSNDFEDLVRAEITSMIKSVTFNSNGVAEVDSGFTSGLLSVMAQIVNTDNVHVVSSRIYDEEEKTRKVRIGVRTSDGSPYSGTALVHFIFFTKLDGWYPGAGY